MESPIIDNPSEEQQEFISGLQPEIIIEANIYKTRLQPITIRINNSQESWHSLKGGFNPGKNHTINASQPSYEVLYQPETKRWLKIVPPEAVGKYEDTLRKRLQLGAQIGRTASKLANLPEFAGQFIEYNNLFLKGKETYGFTSPHIGPSAQFGLAKLPERFTIRDRESGKGIKDFFGVIYKKAFIQAVNLYLDFGYWTSDPNPGNILLHFKEGKIYVMLIDFTNQQQIKNHLDIPNGVDEKYFPSIRRTRERVRRNNLLRLYKNFAHQCAIYRLPFYSYPEEFQEISDEALTSHSFAI